ncbi:MAG: N-acetylmuramic acid 6-phosphate etherase [Thermomicrobiales bacterium]
MTDNSTRAPDLAHLSQLTTEQQNPASADIDMLDTEGMLRVINDEDARIAAAVRAEIPAIARAVDAIVSRIEQGGRLIYIGAGTSGRLGVLDASECPPTFNTPPDLVVGVIAGGDYALRHPVEAFEDQEESGATALDELHVSERDAVVGIAASGRTPFVLGAMAHARELGAVTIGISNTENSRLSAAVDIPITPVAGPEILSGSTRMKAGTAQKLVLNMLSTGAMIRLGKTYGNLMVDMQSTNAKLRRRAIGMVQRVTGLDEAAAAETLKAADGDVKTAIVMIRLAVSRDAAQDRLAAARGRLRIALGETA